MSRRIFILGSTGSIGCSTVRTILHLRSRDGKDSWPVGGLAAGANFPLLKEQSKVLKVNAVSVHVDTSLGTEHQYSSAVELLESHAKRGDLVVAAIVGFAGIAPVLLMVMV